jgi:hypothetical protein
VEVILRESRRPRKTGSRRSTSRQSEGPRPLRHELPPARAIRSASVTSGAEWSWRRSSLLLSAKLKKLRRKADMAHWHLAFNRANNGKFREAPMLRQSAPAAARRGNRAFVGAHSLSIQGGGLAVPRQSPLRSLAR